MTIDYGSLGESNPHNQDAAESEMNLRSNLDDEDDRSRSQLTIETEKMMPLAAVDCLLSKTASIASSSQVAVTPRKTQETPDLQLVDDLALKREASATANEYVDNLMKSIFSSSAYATTSHDATHVTSLDTIKEE